MAAEGTSSPALAAVAAPAVTVASTTATATSAAAADTSAASVSEHAKDATEKEGSKTDARVNSTSPTLVEDPTSTVGTGDQSADNQYYPEGEEVLEGDWKRPQLDLKEIETKTGEEDESIFWSKRAKLYRWDKSNNEWKERGLGDAKLLRHNTSGKIRFLLRQEKTHKLMANHYVLRLQPSWCQLKANVGSDRIWVWTVMDSAEDPQRLEQFAVKFGQVESANEFKAKFEEAAELNAEAFKDVLAASRDVAAAKSADSSEKQTTHTSAVPASQAS